MPNFQGVNVEQTTTATGTGDLALDAPATGRRAFSSVLTLRPDGVASTYVTGFYFAPYYISNADGSEWEWGFAEVFNDSANGTLYRSGLDATVIESSSGTSAVNFSAGTKTVRLITPPDVRALNRRVDLTCPEANMLTHFNGNQFVDWVTEVADTDAFFDAANDSSGVYVPMWANEVEVDFRYGVRIPVANQPNDNAPAIRLSLGAFNGYDNFAQPYIPAVVYNPSTVINYAWSLKTVLQVDNAALAGSNRDENDRPFISVDFERQLKTGDLSLFSGRLAVRILS
jgi:hypothetical protein